VVDVADGLPQQVARFGQKVRVAFDWTLDLLFPKDVCAVYDFDRRRDFDRQDHARNTLGSNRGYQLTTRQPLNSSTGNGLTRTDLVGAERHG
jgi:hypothetical protein